MLYNSRILCILHYLHYHFYHEKVNLSEFFGTQVIPILCLRQPSWWSHWPPDCTWFCSVMDFSIHWQHPGQTLVGIPDLQYQFHQEDPLHLWQSPILSTSISYWGNYTNSSSTWVIRNIVVSKFTAYWLRCLNFMASTLDHAYPGLQPKLFFGKRIHWSFGYTLIVTVNHTPCDLIHS